MMQVLEITDIFINYQNRRAVFREFVLGDINSIDLIIRHYRQSAAIFGTRKKFASTWRLGRRGPSMFVAFG
jgi:hypothetical protein